MINSSVAKSQGASAGWNKPQQERAATDASDMTAGQKPTLVWETQKLVVCGVRAFAISTNASVASGGVLNFAGLTV